MRLLPLGLFALATLAQAPGASLLHAQDAPRLGSESAARPLGTFHVTYYWVAEERAAGAWPLFAPACEAVLAHTSEAFHHEVSLEGTGRLLDGRLINFSERCDCAHPGHSGSRICYEWVDAGEFPWGKGGKLEGRDLPLEPFRTVAVDPTHVALGTMLYIPAWQGGHWPDGSPRNGCFRAVDTGSRIAGRHLDLFVGRPHWAKPLQRGGPKRVSVYAGAPQCADGAVR